MSGWLSLLELLVVRADIGGSAMADELGVRERMSWVLFTFGGLGDSSVPEEGGVTVGFGRVESAAGGGWGWWGRGGGGVCVLRGEGEKLVSHDAREGLGGVKFRAT